jgi:hypothetical protein
MPRATIDTHESTKYELKTCEGAWVLIRRLPYGEFLHRQEMAIQLKFESDRQRNSNSRTNRTSSSMTLINKKVTQFEFENCIVDHNLEDDVGEKLDFHDITTLDVLDPVIGNEIGGIINNLHQFEDDLGN